MIFYLQTINFIYALGGLTLLALTLVLAYDYFCNQSRWYEKFIAKYVWYILALVTWGGVATTLFYSEVLGFVPCSLCWLQRVALYPQALMAIIAWRVKDEVMYPLYGIGLSVFGFLVAVYQYIYQLVPADKRESLMPCLVDGTADCGTKVMEVFGFVTFPFLSAVTFAFLILIYLNLRRRNRNA